MKFLISLTAILLLAAAAQAQPILRSGWTTNSDPATARFHLGVAASSGSSNVFDRGYSLEITNSPGAASAHLVVSGNFTNLGASKFNGLVEIINPTDNQTLLWIGTNVNNVGTPFLQVSNSNGGVRVGIFDAAVTYAMNVGGSVYSDQFYSPALRLTTSTGNIGYSPGQATNGVALHVFRANTNLWLIGSLTKSASGAGLVFDSMYYDPTPVASSTNTVLLSTGTGFKIVEDSLTLANPAANSDTSFNLSNDAQTWRLRTYGTAYDQFQLNDVTGSKTPLQVMPGTIDGLFTLTNGLAQLVNPTDDQTLLWIGTNANGVGTPFLQVSNSGGIPRIGFGSAAGVGGYSYYFGIGNASYSGFLNAGGGVRLPSKIYYLTQDSNSPSFYSFRSSTNLWGISSYAGASGAGLVFDSMYFDPTPVAAATNTVVYSTGTNFTIVEDRVTVTDLYAQNVHATNVYGYSSAPKTLADAYEIVESFEATADGKVDHAKLSPKARGMKSVRVKTGVFVTNNVPEEIVVDEHGVTNTVPARVDIQEQTRLDQVEDSDSYNMSMVIFSQAAVIKDLLKRLETLEKR